MLEAPQKRLGLKTNPTVFFVSAAFILAFVVFGAVFEDAAQNLFGAIQRFIAQELGWFYIASVSFFLGFMAWLCASRYGRIRLGDDDDKPEYSYLTWFAMLFSAGMGIGVLFWSVAEPVTHFIDPPTAEPRTVAAAHQAMNFTFLHWGLHGWGIYALVGLSLAYFTYRQKLPLSIRSAFYPVLGDRIYGVIGDAIDVFAVLGTMFGVATTLGLGAQQINAGVNHLWPGIPVATSTQVWLIAGITACATISVVTGLNRGILRLSQTNLWLALFFFVFVLLAGNGVFVLNAFIEDVGYYLQRLPYTSMWADAFADTGWQSDWTLFYWGWWIAWSPFVGVFVARISRGRTIREFILGVLLVPTGVTFLWYSVFGNLAIQQLMAGNTRLDEVVQNNFPLAIYVFLESFPLATVLSIVGTAIITIFFVTSSDSASLVIDMLTAGGDLDPPRRQRVFWATTEGAVAAVLLLAGGLGAMQTFQLTTGLPLALVLIAMCYSLAKGLQGDRAGLSVTEVAQRQPMAEVTADEGGSAEGQPAGREGAPTR